MQDEFVTILNEIRGVLKDISNRQEQLLKNVSELKQEQKRLHDEIKLNNFVINTITSRNEMMN